MKYGYGLKFGPSQAQEMAARNNNGATFAMIADDFGTNSKLVAKYIRAWNRFGKSYWTDYPKEISK